MMKNHPFHLVDLSPWPILISFMIMMSMIGMIKWFKFFNYNLMLLSLINIIIISYQWWRDVIRESTYQGLHSSFVMNNLKLGMILFIISELFLFVSFFWMFFHSSLTPSIELGMNWPPKNIMPFNPMQIPLLNTLILLSSGFSVTWAHQSIMNNNFNQMKMSLMITIMLGIYFTLLQIIEYKMSSFSISDSIYGSSFFLMTGFHGIHVLIGSIFLSICLIRHLLNHFSSIHHFGFEAAIWYWHFVDVVWLFLFISIYWWGK
uniref:Cytochrome c oxidase subunit 3 n=1 Tax=Metopiellus crypticus TaxID=3140185 RepID=A0AAT9QGU1_9COLE|nr:cytochrome c oxidase subunit 3 [Metopiellus sp.]